MEGKARFLSSPWQSPSYAICLGSRRANFRVLLRQKLSFFYLLELSLIQKVSCRLELSCLFPFFCPPLLCWTGFHPFGRCYHNCCVMQRRLKGSLTCRELKSCSFPRKEEQSIYHVASWWQEVHDHLYGQVPIFTLPFSFGSILCPPGSGEAFHIHVQKGESVFIP